MSSLFYRLFRQAKRCFHPQHHIIQNEENFAQNLAQLKQLANQINISDLNINPKLVTSQAFDFEDKAPCTFISIHDSDEFTMAVFILREDYTMPLHDHPHMHGLLRVISGNVRINCYTKISANDDQGLLTVKVEPVKHLSAETEAAVLTPTQNNFHEITAVGGPAAFFDIISPPYDFDHPVFGKRRCSFYEKIVSRSLLAAGQIQLQRIPSPDTYYCDTATYFAPDFLMEQ